MVQHCEPPSKSFIFGEEAMCVRRMAGFDRGSVAGLALDR